MSDNMITETTIKLKTLRKTIVEIDQNLTIFEVFFLNNEIYILFLVLFYTVETKRKYDKCETMIDLEY
jgi:hypothetical protein